MRQVFASTKDPRAQAQAVAQHMRGLLAVPGWLEEQRKQLPDGASEARAWCALAVEWLHACVRVQPTQPLAHFMLAQFLRLQHRYEASWQHAQLALDYLLAQVPHAQVLHLEILNHLLVLLGTTRQYDRFPEWLFTFEHLRAALETTALSDAQQHRLREEEGACALSRAFYLGSAPSIPQTLEILEQQLDSCAEAIAKGTPSTQHVALHRQAETLAHLHRLAEAVATYTRIVQQWPEDRRGRLGLALLTAMRQATGDMTAVDQAFSEALVLACAGTSDAPATLMPLPALDWLQPASPLSLLERLRTCPAFVDVSAYVGAMAEAWRSLLDAPPAAHPRLPEEANAPARSERRRQRRATTWHHHDWSRHAPSAASQAPPVVT